MSKRTSQIVCAGQLNGAKLKIKAVKNDGLYEYVTINNNGTVAQPMSGWVLASLCGQTFYIFPDDLIFNPGMVVVVQSGQQGLEKKSQDWDIRIDLWWTIDQVWNNHGDTAILFDANGLEIDRYSYPHERVVGSSANPRTILLRNNGGFVIAKESPRHAKKVTRKHSGVPANQPSFD
jgi:hypothetical protein